MALEIGDPSAGAGMSKAIYAQLDALLSPVVPADSLPDARKAWRQLAYAIARGVIDHLKTNLEVSGLKVSGTASLTVAGATASGPITLDQTVPSGRFA